MVHDPLDELLDRSAPAFEPAASADLDAMVSDARRFAPRGHRPKVVIAAGLTALFATAGMGVAVATDGLSWAPWAKDPIGAVQFTMTTGLQCELRFSEYTEGADPAYVGEVNGILKDWYRSTDVLAAVEAIMPSTRQHLNLGPAALPPGKTLETLSPDEVEHQEWIRQWTTWDVAVNDAEWEELARHGLQARRCADGWQRAERSDPVFR